MTQGVPLMAGSIGKIPERTTIDQRERWVVGGRQIVEDQKPVTNRCPAQSVETRFLPARVRVQLAAVTYVSLLSMIMVWDASGIWNRSAGLACPLRWRVHGVLAHLTLLP